MIGRALRCESIPYGATYPSLIRPNSAISTHSGHGAKRIGQGISQHGIVYTGNLPPPIASNEAGMQPTPVRINTDDRKDALDATSRLHYGKFYTIEYNVRVKAYGMVHGLSLALLMRQFREVNVGRLGSLDPTLQTHEEQPEPPFIHDPRNHGSRNSSNPVDKSQFLSPQHRQAIARYATIPRIGAAASASPRTNAQTSLRPAQYIATGGGKRAISGSSRPVQTPSRPGQDPPRAILVGMGFDESQIQLVYDLIAWGASSKYAIARMRALREGYAAKYANAVAVKVDKGADYASAVQEIRAVVSAGQRRARATAAANAAAEDDGNDGGDDDDDDNNNNEEADYDDADADDGDDDYSGLRPLCCGDRLDASPSTAPSLNLLLLVGLCGIRLGFS